MRPHRPSLHRWSAACAALATAGCAADNLAQTGAGVVDGTITWERPEVGTLIGDGMHRHADHPQVAVTAAHCVDFGTTTRTGSYGRFVVHASTADTQQRFNVDLYRSFGREDAMDVALVHLSIPVPDSARGLAGIARRHPNAGEAITLFGYGCTRRNTSIGTGQERKFQFAQGSGRRGCARATRAGHLLGRAGRRHARQQRLRGRRDGPRHLRRHPRQLQPHHRADRRVRPARARGGRLRTAPPPPLRLAAAASRRRARRRLRRPVPSGCGDYGLDDLVVHRQPDAPPLRVGRHPAGRPAPTAAAWPARGRRRHCRSSSAGERALRPPHRVERLELHRRPPASRCVSGAAPGRRAPRSASRSRRASTTASRARRAAPPPAAPPPRPGDTTGVNTGELCSPANWSNWPSPQRPRAGDVPQRPALGLARDAPVLDHVHRHVPAPTDAHPPHASASAASGLRRPPRRPRRRRPTRWCVRRATWCG